MENLTKTQFVFLVILVSFVTALFTGIVTVTLMDQAPPPVTQTIQKVIEKVAPGLSNFEENRSATTPATQEDLVVKAVQNVSSAVVSIIATKDLPVFEQYYVNPFSQDEFFKQFIPPELLPNFQIPQYRQKGTEERQVSSGTGFFVSSDGLIATNKHVVEDKEANYSVIMNDGKKLNAKVLALDPLQDIAVIKVEGNLPASGYNYVPLGNSDGLKVGQTVIAIGNALGEFQNTVSVGVISGLHRNIVAGGTLGGGEEVLSELIQTDAAINSGNSGGPLLNLRGEAIGINTAMAQGAENIGFSLPINLVKKDIADVKQFGKIQYAYLGVRYAIINTQIKKEKNLSVDYGALIIKGLNGEAAIMAGSPAEKMGLKEGDIILEFNGTKITGNDTLSSLINRYRAGDKITLKILRNGQESAIQGTLENRPENI